MVVLGINAYHGDASAALVIDGQLVAAAEEERFNRIKHAAGFPANAIRYCLDAAGIKPWEIDHVAVARDPRARVWRKAFYALRMPHLAIERAKVHTKFSGIDEDLCEALGVRGEALRAQIHRIEHHKAHLASAFFVSPFSEAVLLSIDGLGDFASTMWGLGWGNSITVDGAIAFPHSLGIFYTALTQYLGFWKYGDEYKVMGLGSYGEPQYRDEFNKLLKVGGNGRPDFSLGLEHFVHHKNGPEMTWRNGEPTIGKLYSDTLINRLGPARAADEPVEQRHRNIAASLQARLEESVHAILNRLYNRYGVKKLCLAGGVAYNCVANGKIFAKTPFEKVYIQSAAGDAGLAIGGAFYVWSQILGRPRSFEMKHAYWGPEFSDHEIREALNSRGQRSEVRGQLEPGTGSGEQSNFGFRNSDFGFSEGRIEGRRERGAGSREQSDFGFRNSDFGFSERRERGEGDRRSEIPSTSLSTGSDRRSESGGRWSSVGGQRGGAERMANGGWRIAKLSEEELCRVAAERIAEGKVVGWFQGRMEFGPRALGNRSIVADPRRAEMKDVLNSRIKHRESFRPFAPSILAERVGDYFEETHISPFMLMAYKVKQEKRSVIPAPTHVDGTGRLQTVSRDENPRYWKLISEFEKLTGVPVLLNTSFNENEPVVCRPEEAIDCFMRTKMDVLAIGNYLVEKREE